FLTTTPDAAANTAACLKKSRRDRFMIMRGSFDFFGETLTAGARRVKKAAIYSEPFRFFKRLKSRIKSADTRSDLYAEAEAIRHSLDNHHSHRDKHTVYSGSFDAGAGGATH